MRSFGAMRSPFFGATIPFESDSAMQSDLPGEGDSSMQSDISFFDAINSKCDNSDAIRSPIIDAMMPCECDNSMQTDLPFSTRRCLVNTMQRCNEKSLF